MRATKLISAVVAGTGVLFGIIPDCNGAVCEGKINLPAEIPTIRKAAERNGIKFGSDDWYILLAIRKQENGGPGLEFGIMNPDANDLDSQAGWAAATIVKNRARWRKAGKPSCFINYLADRYVPRECDPVGNYYWKRNVHFWFRKLRDGNNTI